MLYWECKRRLEQLRRFRVLVFDYFQNIQMPDWMSAGVPPRMNETAQRARHEINTVMGDVVVSFNLLGVPHVLIPSGGVGQGINVVDNIFALYQFQIDSRIILDFIDRAIGAYERECRKLFRMSFNPLYWLQLLVASLLHLPFKLVSAVGFDTSRIEESWFVKLLKLLVALAAFIASVVAIADHWGMIRIFFEKCAAILHHHINRR